MPAQTVKAYIAQSQSFPYVHHHNKKATPQDTSLVPYSATTRTGHLEEHCPVTTISENKRFSSYFFGERTKKIQNTIIQPFKTLKSFQLTWPLGKQLSNLWMLLVRFPEIVVIGQSFSSAPVRVVALMVFIAKSILRYGVKYYLKTCSSSGKVV